MSKVKQRLGEWVDWIGEHTNGLKTIAGISILAYGYKVNNRSLIELGWYLAGIGTGDKVRKWKQTKSIASAMRSPALTKMAIPFRNAIRIPNKKESQ